MLKLFAYDRNKNIINYREYKPIINDEKSRKKLIDKFYKENKHAYRIKVVF